MILVKKLSLKPNNKEQIVLGCLCYASARLWNVGNYEKKNYKALELEKYPDWYEQKKRLKDNFWYKNLPSQTAQELLAKLERSWKSFFKLVKTKGIENPQPPRFKAKDSKYNISYLNNGFEILDDDHVRFSLPKQLKEYLKDKYSIDDKYLTLKIKNFLKVDGCVKQIEFKPKKDDRYEVNVVYEIADVDPLALNGHFLSIDIGLKNLFTCYDNKGSSFIISGTKYLETMHFFSKKIAHYQSIAYSQQIAAGSKYGKSTKRINELYELKRKRLDHFFHSATKQVIDYCVKNDITQVVIGDIKGIRKKAKLGKVNNQKFHGLPFEKIYSILSYKLLRKGITLIKQKENYSSQCSPFTPLVNKEYATPEKRKKRGLYIDQMQIFNADSVGAFNILRLYSQSKNVEVSKPIKGLSDPKRIHVAV